MIVPALPTCCCHPSLPETTVVGQQGGLSEDDVLQLIEDNADSTDDNDETFTDAFGVPVAVNI